MKTVWWHCFKTLFLSPFDAVTILQIIFELLTCIHCFLGHSRGDEEGTVKAERRTNRW